MRLGNRIYRGNVPKFLGFTITGHMSCRRELRGTLTGVHTVDFLIWIPDYQWVSRDLEFPPTEYM